MIKSAVNFDRTFFMRFEKRG